MNKYTIAERQAIKDRLAEEKYFERDRDLFSQLFPHHPLMSELARVNNVNRLSLCRRMVYQMLQKVDEAAILEWRESGARVAVTLCPENSPESKQVEAPSVPAAPKKNLKAEEFPRINWLDNENPDIQLAILLYDERVNTWKQLCALRADLDDCPEKALAIADFDDRNRMAQHELEVFQDTGVFPCKHPLAVKFTAENKKLSELRALKRDKPDEFLKQVSNMKHNIQRYKSKLKKKDMTAERRAQLERNLENAQRLNELMQRVVRE